MRPDFISESNTPNLYRLAHEGVEFKNHHAVYLPATEVNGTALATGMYPERSHLIGNKEYRPEIDPDNPVRVEEIQPIRRGDELTHGNYLAAPTLPEMLQKKGLWTAVAATKPIGILWDRASRASSSRSSVVFDGRSLPENLLQKLNVAGVFPPSAVPRTDRDRWTTRVLTQVLLNNGLPPFSVLWLNEPDFTQHNTGVGSAVALKAIRASDERLADVFSTLRAIDAGQSTDVIVVSDHGFSTIAAKVDVADVLTRGGFPAVRQLDPHGKGRRPILAVSNGGSCLLYVDKKRADSVPAIAHFLQKQPFCGAIAARQKVSGAFQLEELKINSPEAPDIVVAMRWSSDRNTNGVPGLVWSDISEFGPGAGAHACLSPYELHNVCVAAGPHFRKGLQSFVPSGNVDIAPTVLRIFGIKPALKMSGRVLTEALGTETLDRPKISHRTLDRAWSSRDGKWKQSLNYSLVEGVVYLDECRGEWIQN
jgi:arylsulfatase A-like enzyme